MGLITGLRTWFTVCGLVVANAVLAQTVTFDIGTNNWTGNFPGPGAYSEVISGIQVDGVASRVVDNNVDATAVFSGNENPAIARNFTYTFPPNSTVSIDFFHLTVNSSNQAESVGNFSQAPDQTVVGQGHSIQGLDLRLEGSDVATVDTVSTLTWEGVSSVSFDIASNGNIAFIGHRNLVVTRGQPVAVPLLSHWGMMLFVLALAVTTFTAYNIRKPKKNGQ